MADFIPSVRNLYLSASTYFKNSSPMAFNGDFNGDGVKDIVLLGHNKKKSLTLLLVSNQFAYKVITLRSEKYENPKNIEIEILTDDKPIIEKGLEPENNKIAVCFLDGEFTVKRLRVSDGEVWLQPENPNYPIINITEENDFVIWGIVTSVIKKV